MKSFKLNTEQNQQDQPVVLKEQMQMIHPAQTQAHEITRSTLAVRPLLP